MLFFVSVLCIATNSSTMVAAGAMRRRHSPNGSIQWLLVGNVPRIAPLHLHGDQNHQCLTCMLCCHQLVDGHSKKTCYGCNKLKASKKTCYGCNKLKARYNIFLLVVINLFVLYGRPPTMVLATIFYGGRTSCRNHE